ncbi:MAG: amidoligase family protein [Pseudomonadales bacterium]|nr:amidoligase family protein [Pseudomonadales bacterium]
MTKYIPDSILYKSDGEVRRVGFEIEFSGLTFQRCLDVIQAKLGDDISRDSQVEATNQNTK